MVSRALTGVYIFVLLLVLVGLLAGCSATSQVSESTHTGSATVVMTVQAPTLSPSLSPTAPDALTHTPKPSPQPPSPTLPSPTPPPTPSAPPLVVPTLAPATPSPSETQVPTSTLPRPTPTPATTTSQPQPAPSRGITPVPARSRRYVFPIQPPRIGSYGPCHHDYPASDIFVPIGSHFVAVIDAIVDFVSDTDEWDPKVNAGSTRGGLSVAIVGDDGVRYYGSHLSRIAESITPGVRVQAGQRLGLTGKSGDARVTAPHLHFGISHPTSPGDWAVRRGEINPYRYLNAWRKGVRLTPDLTRPDGGAC